MHHIFFIFAVVCSLAAGSLSAGTYGVKSIPNQVIKEFDVDRYLGEWNEAARFPNPFQKNCVSSTAKYERSTTEEGKIDVVNLCIKKGNKSREVKGTGWVESGGKIKVAFTSIPFLRSLTSGDYLILYTDYKNIAVVGSSNKKYGWILTRGKELSKDEYQLSKKIFEKSGYYYDKLRILMPIR